MYLYDETELDSVIITRKSLCNSYSPIGHVNNIPTMQLFTGIPRNTQSKCYMLTSTGCVWEFPNNALWDAH